MARFPARDGHSSGTPIAERLKQPTRAVWSGERLEAEASAPPLFGFAPGGVYHATTVASRAVGSYPTLSPLPPHVKAVCFLWHFP